MFGIKQGRAPGFRAHSGWAAMVAVAGTILAPLVIERRRVVIADPSMAGSKQPYHAAALRRKTVAPQFRVAWENR